MDTIKRLSLRGQTPPKERSNNKMTNGESDHVESISKEELVASNLDSALSSPENEQPPVRSVHRNDLEPLNSGKDYIVKVKLLDDKQLPLEFYVPRDVTGQWILDEVCTKLGGLKERDYFGLTFNDKESQWQWLELGRNAYKQLKQVTPCDLNFRVKHYPPQPAEDLKQDLSRYFLYLQLRMDLLKGRLLCDSEDTSQLAAYISQSELGDYDELDDKGTYLSHFKLVNKQPAKLEEKIKQKHAQLTGMSIREAEQEFLKLACKQETYGIYPFQVKNQDDGTIYLGLKHDSIVTFVGSKRAHTFPWAEILKMHCEGKHFIIHVTQNVESPYPRKANKHSLHFRCENKRTAQAIWKWAIDRQCFFTLSKSDEARKVKSSTGLFKRSQTFRFSGRCQREILSSSQIWKDEPQPVFVRVSSIRKDERKAKSLSLDAAQRFATFPRRHKTDSEEEDKHASNPALQPPVSGDTTNEDTTASTDVATPGENAETSTAEVEVVVATRIVTKESALPPTQNSTEYEDNEISDEEDTSQDNLSLNIIEEEDTEELLTGQSGGAFVQESVPEIIVTDPLGQENEIKEADDSEEPIIPLDEINFVGDKSGDDSPANDNNNVDSERISRELSSAVKDIDALLEGHENNKSKLPNGQPSKFTELKESDEPPSPPSPTSNGMSIALLVALCFIFAMLTLIVAMESGAKSSLLQFGAIREFHEHLYQPVRKGLFG